MSAAALLAGCGSADDLKARWVDLPVPPETLTLHGPGTSEIADLDLANWEFQLNSIQFLDAFDDGVFPERSYASGSTPEGGYTVGFHDGAAEIELGEDATRSGVATVRLSFDEGDIYYSDANGDSYQDAMIILDQTVEYYESHEARETGRSKEERRGSGILALTYSEESIGRVHYMNLGPLDRISAIDGGFSMTTVADGVSDTIEMGWPEGVPVRIDAHGGALQCARSEAEIEEALESAPVELESLNAFPDRSVITGYEEQALFPLPVEDEAVNSLRYSGYQRMMFLLDGGDISRWSDYRCGWASASDL